MGYFMLGYFLYSKKDNMSKKTETAIYVIGILMLIATIAAECFISEELRKTDFVKQYMKPNVILYSAAIYTFFVMKMSKIHYSERTRKVFAVFTECGFGVWYELHMTHIKALPTINGKPMKLRKRSLAALFMSSCVMLISAKYAWYIILFAALLAIINDRKRWKTYVVALMLPTVLIHGGLVYLVNSGAVIGGDPIESRGIQLQQIARVAKYNPQGIPEDAAKKLAPVFNLDQMAESYFQQDADPVKSSGIQSKKVSYKWRTVTKDDMKDFNDAWWQIVKANPQIALDALFAECFGYFNVTDLPYVSMDYYVNNDYVQSDNEWIHLYNHQWRNQVAGFAKKWGQIPVLGWVTHGNLYVTLTLLIGAAEVVLRRWRSLSWHLPLLLLMGVMITAPANNFERHMLPIAFVFGFLCLEFWRESRAARLAAREASYVGTSTAGKRRIGGHRIDRQQSDKQDADERYLDGRQLDGRQLDGQEKES